MHQRSCWQGQQIHAVRADIFAEVAGAHRKTTGHQLFKQFTLQQMHLPQIGLTGIARHTRAMLHGHTRMGVTFHTQARNEFDNGLRQLAEIMVAAAVNRKHCGHAGSRHRVQLALTAATSLSAQASACAASRASTMTRTSGSVPLARINTLPLLPSSVLTASVSEASSLLPAQS